jgi:hypothetical protein
MWGIPEPRGFVLLATASTGVSGPGAMVARTLRALDLDGAAVAHIEANDVAAFGR